MGQAYTTATSWTGVAPAVTPPAAVLLGPSGVGKTSLHRRLAFDPDRPGAFTGPLRTTRMPVWGDVTVPPAATASGDDTSSAAAPPEERTLRLLDVGGGDAARAEWPTVLVHAQPAVVVFVLDGRIDATDAEGAACLKAARAAFEEVLEHRDVIKDDPTYAHSTEPHTSPATAVNEAHSHIVDAAVVVAINSRREDELSKSDGDTPVDGETDDAAATVDDSAPGDDDADADAAIPGWAKLSSKSRRLMHGFADVPSLLAAAVTRRRGPHAVLAPGSVCNMRFAVAEADFKTGQGVDDLVKQIGALAYR